MDETDSSELEALKEVVADLELRVVELEQVLTLLERRVDKLAGKQVG